MNLKFNKMSKNNQNFNSVELTFTPISPKRRMPRLSSKNGIFSFLFSLIPEEKRSVHSQLWIVLISDDDYCLGTSSIQPMSLHNGELNIREVMQLALISNSSKIIVAGTRGGKIGNFNEPTSLEIEFAKKIKQFGKIVEVELIDFRILKQDSTKYISLKEMEII
jgi:DNA repair protein RadC